MSCHVMSCHVMSYHVMSCNRYMYMYMYMYMYRYMYMYLYVYLYMYMYVYMYMYMYMCVYIYIHTHIHASPIRAHSPSGRHARFRHDGEVLYEGPFRHPFSSLCFRLCSVSVLDVKVNSMILNQMLNLP